MTHTSDMLQAASDFQAAADILTDANAPVHVLADLLDEADYLRTGDLEPLGTAEGAQGRYVATSRICRRGTVCDWIGDRTPTAAQQRALNVIGGTCI